ncbi:MAG: DNA repair protein RecO [Pseudomonadota bacterium]
MEWREDAVLLTIRPHGETAAIAEVFAAGQGRYAGVVRGGTSRRMAPILQPGAQLDVSWRARLSEHIGVFAVEPITLRAAAHLSDRGALLGLSAVTSLLAFCLPERVPYAALYARSIALLDGLGAERWALAYLGWEVALLETMGFGLDLRRCAVTGATDDLAFVSPRTGRAVARTAAGDWADRLLPLPDCLTGGTHDVSAGLRVTGHFLNNHLAPSLGDRPIPAARDRLAAWIGRGT